MGSHRAQAFLIALGFLTTPALAQEAGWRYSPLPGEGDRASMGCNHGATPEDFTCLVVRCEDDYSNGIHVHTSRPHRLGIWEMTLDRENAGFTAIASDAPYGGQFVDNADFLLDRILQGTFVYLRHVEDPGSTAYIDLGGSLFAVNAALAYCAPRVPAHSEPNAEQGVVEQ